MRLLKWALRLLVLLIVLAGAAVGVMAMITAPMPSHPYTDTREVLVIAHRGGRGLWPENTMYAFEQAARMGVDVLEFDVHTTADSVLVVIHDDTVDRTTDGTGRVEDLPFEALRRLDAGYRWSGDGQKTFPYRGRGLTIPTLEEALEAFPGRRMNIELKSSGMAVVERFVRTIREHQRIDRTLVASFNGETIGYLRGRHPTLATAATAREAVSFLVLHALRLDVVYIPAAQAFQVPPSLFGVPFVDRRYVRNAHRHNMDVHVWTINDPEVMRRLIDAGVDGIMTDYPDRLLGVLGRARTGE
jgi:glycerophosphoryl diester phosphodiesterase